MSRTSPGGSILPVANRITLLGTIGAALVALSLCAILERAVLPSPSVETTRPASPAPQRVKPHKQRPSTGPSSSRHTSAMAF